MERLKCSDLHELIYQMQLKREDCKQYMALFEFLMNILNKSLFGDYDVAIPFVTIEQFTDLLVWGGQFASIKDHNIFPKNDRRRYEFINHIANNYYRIYHVDNPKLYADNQAHGSKKCLVDAPAAAPQPQFRQQQQPLARRRSTKY